MKDIQIFEDRVHKRDHPERPGRCEKQRRRLDRLRKLGIATPRCLGIDGDTYIWERIVGPTAHEIRGTMSYLQHIRFCELQLRLKDLKVRDTNLKNFVWSESKARWYLVDCGAIG